MQPLDRQELCRLLQQLSPGEIDAEVFRSIARLIVTTTFVVVPLLKRGDRLFVLLHDRGAADLYYPSMLDVPGTVIRATDQTLQAAYKRLMFAELPNVSIIKGPVFVDNVFDAIVRG